MVSEFAGLGVRIPEILLPNPQVDLNEWAVVACDQYTSQPEYWEKVVQLVGDAPSTLNLIYPEVYLGSADGGERIQKIQQTMAAYLEKQVLVSQGPGFIFVKRQIAPALSRQGLLLALDLECYDYHPGSQTLIRATEGTVLERIPPRVKIRAGAPIESPHIMVLIDDPQQQVIEPIAAQRHKLTQTYQADLMMGGGRIEGYQVADTGMIQSVLRGLTTLADPNYFKQKYGLTNQNVLLFAVGDGNHSLATAKAVWENTKQTLCDTSVNATANHPGRYALVELVNVHDPGLLFAPIHRVVFNTRVAQMLNSMKDYYESVGSGFRYEFHDDKIELGSKLKNLREQVKNTHFIEFISQTESGLVAVSGPRHNLEVGTLQAFLDHFVRNHSEAEVDYIHGEEVVAELGAKSGNLGFYLPVMDKADLFKTVILDGVLPRKTFSMGEASEKRYYMECRKIM